MAKVGLEEAQVLAAAVRATATHSPLADMEGMEVSQQAALADFQEPIRRPMPSQHMVAMEAMVKTHMQLAVVEVAMAVVSFSTLSFCRSNFLDVQLRVMALVTICKG